MMKVRRMLTEVLLEVTNEEMQMVAEDTLSRARSKGIEKYPASWLIKVGVTNDSSKLLSKITCELLKKFGLTRQIGIIPTLIQVFRLLKFYDYKGCLSVLFSVSKTIFLIKSVLLLFSNWVWNGWGPYNLTISGYIIIM